MGDTNAFEKSVLVWSMCIIAVAIGTLFGVWPAIAGWFTKSDSQAPAWVQAVGSVAAILVAVWIADRQSREQRRIQGRRDTAVAAIAAAGLDDAITSLQFEMQKIYEYCTHIEGDAVAFIDRSLKELQIISQPSREHLLDLAPVIPEAAVAYVHAFRMRSMMINMLQNIQHDAMLALPIDTGRWHSLGLLANKGAERCSCVMDSFLPLALGRETPGQVDA